MRFPIKELPTNATEYITWRYAVKALFFALVTEVSGAINYWAEIDSHHDGNMTFEDLANVTIALKKIDTKMFASIIGALKGSVGSKLLQKISARCTFGSGRQAMAVLDRYHEYESKLLGMG